MLLRREGRGVNLKCVYRLYREARPGVRLAVRNRLKRPVPDGLLLRAAKEEWALDFLSDAVAGGGRIRILTVLERYTRQCPGIEVGASLGSRKVTQALEWMIARRGTPKRLRCDNGGGIHEPALSRMVREAGRRSRPRPAGGPIDNGYLESFNGGLRDEFLNANWLANLARRRRRSRRGERGKETFSKEHNTERPHGGLGYRTPNEYAEVRSKLISRMDAIPPICPSLVVSSTAVLAGKGSPPAAP